MNNPGSPEAVANGCTCATADNAHGQGIPGSAPKTFWINETCPLHSLNAIKERYFPWLDESDNMKDIFSKT